MLRRAGFDVVGEARDGIEAVALARDRSPDLALLDVRMPGMDGIEAARAMLEERPIPVVIITAYSQRDVIERAVEAGVFGYLVKPFQEADLVPAIETARARHAELETLRSETASLRDALAARKVIERAKGLLMERDGLTEAEAFGRMRSAAQHTGKTLLDIAEAISATYLP
ncbi:MAG TPA: response regulator [Gaiellales bacterium]